MSTCFHRQVTKAKKQQNKLRSPVLLRVPGHDRRVPKAWALTWRCRSCPKGLVTSGISIAEQLFSESLAMTCTHHFPKKEVRVREREREYSGKALTLTIPT